jgi:RimJ/RimL family protein N-acetyltransferase
MLAELEGWFRQLGVQQLRLDCYVENTGAIRAYEKLDFQPYQVFMTKNL